MNGESKWREFARTAQKTDEDDDEDDDEEEDRDMTLNRYLFVFSAIWGLVVKFFAGVQILLVSGKRTR
jgi:hypothetical protein